MQQSTPAQIIESMLSKLQAPRWENDEQALFDYPNQQANPHFHFAFDSPEIAEAKQVTVTLLGRGDNFQSKDGGFMDLHLTPLGVFSTDGFVKFLEGLLATKS